MIEYIVIWPSDEDLEKALNHWAKLGYRLAGVRKRDRLILERNVDTFTDAEGKVHYLDLRQDPRLHKRDICDPKPMVPRYDNWEQC